MSHNYLMFHSLQQMECVTRFSEAGETPKKKFSMKYVKRTIRRELAISHSVSQSILTYISAALAEYAGISDCVFRNDVAWCESRLAANAHCRDPVSA